MRKYWLKIGFTALAIGLVGFGVVTAAKRGKEYIVSAKDLTIPLGSFVSFKLDGVKAGSLRSLSILRSAPKEVTGFRVSVRLTDAAAFDRLQTCKLAVDDVQRFDENTSFRCLTDSAGYETFGEVNFRLQVDGDNRQLITPLYLPEQAIQNIRNHASNEVGAGFADSLADAVRSQIEPQAKTYADSIRADRLDRAASRMTKSAEDLKAQADSLRSRHPATQVAPKAVVKP